MPETPELSQVNTVLTEHSQAPKRLEQNCMLSGVSAGYNKHFVILFLLTVYGYTQLLLGRSPYLVIPMSTLSVSIYPSIYLCHGPA